MNNNQNTSHHQPDKITPDNDYISTQIETLDELLGGKGFKKGTINIIKGGPGSGKTTLGLQILNEHLKKNLKSNPDVKYNSVFISLEVPGGSAVDYINNAYEFKFKETVLEDKFCYISRHELEDALSESIYGDIITNPIYFLQDKINKKIKQNLYEKKIKTDQSLDENDQSLGKKKEKIIRILDKILEKISQSLGKKKVINDPELRENKENIDLFKKGYQNIIFIDSLNVFVDILNLKSGFKYDMRALINVICGELPSMEFKQNSIFIFSVEYRALANRGQSLLSESFLSDTEILLNAEALIGINSKLRNETSATGYEILADKENKKEIETRPFCRIIKSRYSQSQSRRCFYDIKPGIGIKFKDIFPGDGELNLFFENAPQQKYWEDCFKFDLKFSYPALRHTTFDRENLQRTFSSLRQLKYIPEKTDLYFTSLDNYWINWYADLRRKSFIAGIIDEIRPENKKAIEKEKTNTIINTVHRELTTNKINTDIIEKKIKKLLKLHVKSLKNRDTNKIIPIKSKKYKEFIELYESEATEKIENEIFNILTRHNFIRNYNCNYRVWLMLLTTYSLPEDDMYLKEVIKASILKIGTSEQWDKDEIKKILNDLKTKHPDIKVDVQLFAEHLNNIFSLICENDCKNIKENIANKYNSFLKDKTNKAEANLKKKNEDLEYGTYVKLLNDLRKEFANKADIENPDRCPNIWFCKKCYTNKKKIVRKDCWKFLSDLKKDIKRGLELSNEGEIYSANINIGFSHSDMSKIVFASYKKLLYALSGEIKNTGAIDIKIKPEEFIPCFISSYCNLNKALKSYLEVIPSEKIRLFGEVKSEIIRELSNFNFKENRPIHNSDSLFSLRDKNKYISIPYNANVSYVVYRKDLLDEIYKTINTEELVKKVEDIFESEINLINMISDYESELLKNSEISEVRIDKSTFSEKIRVAYPNGSIKDQATHMLIKNMVTQNIARKTPKTWEEIIALFLLAKKGHKPHFLIETRTFDTYMTTFLEFFWSFDCDLHVLPDYSIENPFDTFIKLMLAYNLVGLMSHNNIIPQNSTVDAAKINTNNISEKENWVFARHWHSTFVDFLTYENKEKVSSKKFFEKNPLAKFELMPIPTSLFTYIGKKHMTKHISSWGDWHFAIIKGSENLNLGIDIINNLMSSNKISERAFSAAELPTVEKFYKLHGDTTCFNMEDINSKNLPETTFNQMRQSFFKNAKCRSQIFDYRHTISELGAIFQYAHFGAYPFKMDGKLNIPQNNLLIKKIYKRLNKAFEIINNFVKEDIMRN